MNRFVLLLFLALTLIPRTTQAEPLFAVSSDDQGYYSSILDVAIGTQFDVIALLDSDGLSTSATEFYMTDLTLIAPGVFKLNTVLIGNPPIDLSIWPAGEYVFSFGICADPGQQLELARVRYGTFGGPVPADTILTIRGLRAGDSMPSSFNGSPGVVDCDGNLVAGSMGGYDAVCSGSGAYGPRGSLLINGTPGAVYPCHDPTGFDETSIGMVKCRY